MIRRTYNRCLSFRKDHCFCEAVAHLQSRAPGDAIYPSAFSRNHTPRAAVTTANMAAPMNSHETSVLLPLTRDTSVPTIQPAESRNITIAAISHPVFIASLPDLVDRVLTPGGGASSVFRLQDACQRVASLSILRRRFYRGLPTRSRRTPKPKL